MPLWGRLRESITIALKSAASTPGWRSSPLVASMVSSRHCLATMPRSCCAQDTASPDIDIALDDNVMGAQFAAAVSQYLVGFRLSPPESVLIKRIMPSKFCAVSMRCQYAFADSDTALPYIGRCRVGRRRGASASSRATRTSPSTSRRRPCGCDALQSARICAVCRAKSRPILFRRQSGSTCGSAKMCRLCFGYVTQGCLAWMVCIFEYSF